MAPTLENDHRPFILSLSELQPTQLYLSAAKVNSMLQAPHDILSRPIPVKELDDDIIITDGHTRAYMQWVCGINEVEVVWDDDELDMAAYSMCVLWCKEEGVTHVKHLQRRVVSAADYQKLWIDRCKSLHDNDHGSGGA